MPFPADARWAVFSGTGNFVDSGVQVFRPPREVIASGQIEQNDHGQLVIVDSDEAIELTVSAGRGGGFRTSVLQLSDGVANIVAADGVLLEPKDMATGGKGSLCLLIAREDDDFVLAGQTGPAQPIDGGGTVPTAPPTNVDVPAVTGPSGLTGAAVGDTLTCTKGNWTGTPDSYSYAWASDSAPNGATGETYSVTPNDVGHRISCVVTATNAAGSIEAPASNEVLIS